MGKMEVDRHGFKIEEHVFHRYFSLYTIGLRYYPELTSRPRESANNFIEYECCFCNFTLSGNDQRSS